MFFALYLIYLTFLILFIFIFVYLVSLQTIVCSDTLDPLSSIEILQKIDQLFLQKQEELQKIEFLQEQIISILNTPKKNSLEMILAFFAQNQNYIIGTSIFFLTILVIRYFGQSDLELIIIEILKAQKLGHDGHIEITLELLQKFSQIILENISKITHLQNSSSDLYLDQSFDIILKNMSELDRINILSLLQKIQEISLKVQNIDSQLLQLIDILNR